MNGRIGSRGRRWTVALGLTVFATVLATAALAVSGAFRQPAPAAPSATMPANVAAATATPRAVPSRSPGPPATTRPLPTIDPFTPFPGALPTYPPGGPWSVGPITFELPAGWGIPNAMGLSLRAYLSSIGDPDAGIYHMALPGGRVPRNLAGYRFFETIDGHGWDAGLRTQTLDEHGADADAMADDLVSELEDLGQAVERRSVDLPIGPAQQVSFSQSYGSTVIHFVRFLIGAGDTVVAIDLGTTTPAAPELLDEFLTIVRSARA